MLTNLESKVWAAAVAICMNGEYSTSAKELAEHLDLPINTVKGAVGSLVKKNRMIAEEREVGRKVYLDLIPMNEEGQILDFGDWV